MRQLLTCALVCIMIIGLFPYTPVAAVEIKVTGANITYSDWDLAAYYGGNNGPNLREVHWNNQFLFTVISVPYVLVGSNDYTCSLSGITNIENAVQYYAPPGAGYAYVVIMYEDVWCTDGGYVDIDVYFWLMNAPDIYIEVEVSSSTAKSMVSSMHFNPDFSSGDNAVTDNYAYLVAAGSSDNIQDSVQYRYETHNIIDAPEGGNFYPHNIIITYDGLTAADKLYIYDNLYHYLHNDGVWEMNWINKYTSSDQNYISPDSYDENECIYDDTNGAEDIHIVLQEKTVPTTTHIWFGCIVSLI